MGGFGSRIAIRADSNHPLRQVARVVAQRALERMRFDVGFVDDVQPELVAQIEETGSFG